MRKIIILLVFINLPLLIFSKSFVIKTAYDSYLIDEISQTMIYTDDITKKKSNYRVLEVEFEPNSGFKLIATLDGEDYLFDVYSIDGIQYITKYHHTYPEGSKILLFETPKGKINFSEFYDYYSRNLDSGIELNELSGSAANAYRNETMKYLEGIRSGNIIKLNLNRTYSMINTSGFFDYSNWKPKIKKGSAWKGTSDSYIIDDDFARNLAIGILTDKLMFWNTIKEDSLNKQWVKIMRSEIKSIYEE